MKVEEEIVKKNQTDKASNKSSSGAKSSDYFSDFDSCEGDYQKVIPKFNLEEFENKNREQQEYLSQ